MKSADILLFSSGSLARGVANALSPMQNLSLRVAILARSQTKASQLALIANARARIFRSRVTFTPIEVAGFNASAISPLVRSLKPKIIFQAASLQSPWESSSGQTAWTKLIASAGFGITLPLQMALAAEISRAASDSRAVIVNASYPDGVNVALDRLGLRVTCGIGNSAIVEAFCRSHAKTKSTDVRVIAHHGHLTPWLQAKSSAALPRAWIAGREVDSLRFRPGFNAFGEDSNDVTSSTAVSVMLSLLSGKTLHISTPGVAGLPGGYPFLLKAEQFSLLLPPGVTREQAIGHNKSGEHADGFDLAAGVKFTESARRALAAVHFEFAEGFAFEDWQAARDKMLALRDRLRSQPA